ncbi:MAG TPA: GIY-YIG nuclease family protein [Allocoleopsis sp.]
MILGAENTGYIYYIICTANGRGYVGQTRSLWNRIRTHILNAGGDRATKALLWNFNFAKYGISHYKVEILETPAVKDLDERERYWQEEKRAILSCQKTHRLVNAVLKKEGNFTRMVDRRSRQTWEDITLSLSAEQQHVVLEVVQQYGHTDQPCESNGIPLEWFVKAEDYELDF